MKTFIRGFSLLSVLLGVLILIPCSYAQDWGGQRDKMRSPEQRQQKREEMQAKMHEKLGITDEQAQQLEEHRKQFKEQGKQYREQIKTKRQSLAEELKKDAVDEAKVHQIHEELKVIKDQAEDHRLQGILEVRQILTPEQFKEFSGMREKRKGKFGRDGRKGSRAEKEGPMDPEASDAE